MREAYKNPSFSPEERTRDLLGRMTLEEKIGQMCQVDGNYTPEFWINERHVGSFLHVVGEKSVRLQKLASETRLGIPLIFGIDAIHGHAFCSGATVFPLPLGLASSWDTELIRDVGRITAKEVALNGLHWTFSPVICLGRDSRWGRTDETFGEDPYLAGRMAAAMIKGYQGEDLSEPYSILACAKHFAAHGETQGGRDSTESDVSERKLRTIFLPPFKAAADAGCATFMAAYQSINGVPCSANRHLLNDILKEEWGFDGLVVTDWDNVGYMHRLQKVAASLEEAVKKTVAAGNDMVMSTPEFYENAVGLVKRGLIEEKCIDEACARILKMKFRLGLFDHKRYPEIEKSKIFIGCDEHKSVAFNSALESIVLLKNDNNTLPLLLNKIKNIAVIGPSACDVQAQLGDWSFGPRYYPEKPTIEYNEFDTEPIVTIIDGIRKRAGSDAVVYYEKGCDLLDRDNKNILKAVQVAGKSDVVIAVIGDTVLLNGETRDRAGLDLTGAQQELLEALKATGKPLVVVLINGKPLTIPWVKENADAVLEAWNPGMEGGSAVASILFGDFNPCGKLTISFPYAVGQQPVFYNQYPGWHGGRYIDVEPEPLFPFGYGLSYTSFEYSGLSLSSKEVKTDDEITAAVNVKNTGIRSGTEVVQVYINDIFSSVTTPVKELKGFARVSLDPGEEKKVEIKIPVSSLALVNAECEEVVEPGEFEIMVGCSSKDSDLLKDTFKVV